LRIDAHHSFSERYPIDYLQTILKRNRFDASIAVVDRPVPQWYVIRASPTDLWHLNEWQRDPLFRGVCLSLQDAVPPELGELARRDVPLDLELTPEQLPLVHRIAERYPDLPVAIDRLPLKDWDSLDLAARHPNVYCKLNAITTIDFRPAVQHALAIFGPRRLMFGSDWPNHLPEVSWKATLAAFTQSIGAQPIEIREELLGGTAQRFYRIN
jgi:predicted TIM-barrel fold metal-dependent hydrolase